MLKKLQISQLYKILFAVWTICIVVNAVINSVVLASAFAKTLDDIISKLGYKQNIVIILALTLVSVTTFLFATLMKNKLASNSTIKLKSKFLKNLQNNSNIALLKSDSINSLYNTATDEFIEKGYTYLNSKISVYTTIIVGCVYAAYTNIAILIFSVLLTLLILKLNNSNSNQAFKLSADVTERQSVKNSKVWDHIENHEISQFLNQNKIYKGLDNSIQNYENAIQRLKASFNLSEISQGLGTTILTVSILILGGILSYMGKVTVAQVYALVLVIPKVATGFFRLPDIKNNKKALDGQWSKLERYLSDESNNLANFDEKVSNISIRNLNFRYNENSDWVLKDISFDFNAGEHIGIFAPSGKGKSTLLSVLMGFLDSENSVFVNKKDLHNIDKQDYLKNISYISQNGHLVKGTILDNIKLGQNSGADVDQILIDINFADRIATMPYGLLTDVSTLSSGEKQKVSFARALYQDRPVLILDEALSAMDTDSQSKIMDTIKTIAHSGKMVISVSHNPEWLKCCDKVLYL